MIGDSYKLSLLEEKERDIYVSNSHKCEVSGVKNLDLHTALKLAELLRDEDLINEAGHRTVRKCDASGYCRWIELREVFPTLLNKVERELKSLLPERNITSYTEKIIIA